MDSPFLPLFCLFSSYGFVIVGMVLFYIHGNGGTSHRYYQLDAWAKAGGLLVIFGVGLFFGVMLG